MHSRLLAMSKRTTTCPYIVEHFSSGAWRVVAYEKNERFARKVARRICRDCKVTTRVRHNPDFSAGLDYVVVHYPWYPCD